MLDLLKMLYVYQQMHEKIAHPNFLIQYITVKEFIKNWVSNKLPLTS